LKSELARFCLPEANRDPARKLAWVNSICLLFLAVGLLGAKPAAISAKGPPPIEEAVPAIIEPLPPPPTQETRVTTDDSPPDKPDVPQVVVVTPETPAVSFSVPTIGNILAPSSMASAPPLEPMRAVAPLKNRPSTLDNTGKGGERPEPPYPKILQEQGEQGMVRLQITVNDAGGISDIQVAESSGFPALDRTALEYIRKHWIIPPAGANHLFETSITYKLQR
jgi:protein TonB